MADWQGSDYAAVIAATAAAIVSIGAFGMSTWNNSIARSTHTLVNSNMTEFKAALIAAGILKEEAAEASGALRGGREERADQALRDQPSQLKAREPGSQSAASDLQPGATGDIEGTIKGKIETKPTAQSGAVPSGQIEGKLKGTIAVKGK